MKKNQPVAALRRCKLQVASLVDGSFAPTVTSLTSKVFVRLGGPTFVAAGGTWTNTGQDGSWIYEFTQAETNVVANEIEVRVIDATWYASTLVELLDPADRDASVLHYGTAQAGGGQSITLAAGAPSVSGAFTDATIAIVGGTGAGQVNSINTYSTVTKIAQVFRQWNTTPDATSQYVIFQAPTPMAAVTTLLDGPDVDDAYKLGDLVRGFASVLFGKMIEAPGSATFRNLADTKDRITVNYDATGRPSVAIIDLTP